MPSSKKSTAKIKMIMKTLHKMIVMMNKAQNRKVHKKKSQAQKLSKGKQKIEAGPEIKLNCIKNDPMYHENPQKKIKISLKLKSSKIISKVKKK